MKADRNGRNMLQKINECIVFRTTMTERHDKIFLDITYSLRKLLQAIMFQTLTREAPDSKLSQEADYSEQRY
jgi:hypothetical protein